MMDDNLMNVAMLRTATIARVLFSYLHVYVHIAAGRHACASFDACTTTLSIACQHTCMHRCIPIICVHDDICYFVHRFIARHAMLKFPCTMHASVTTHIHVQTQTDGRRASRTLAYYSLLVIVKL